MTSAIADWSLTGQVAGRAQSLPSGTKAGVSTSSGGGTTTSSESSSQTQVTSRQNTPDFALKSLEELIAQLSDSPNLSDAAVATKFPLAQRVALTHEAGQQKGSFRGFGFQIPGGGTIEGPTAAADAQRFNEGQLAKRAEAQRASGISPGGTAASRNTQAQIDTELDTNRKTREGFSKEAAFADATALSARFSRQLLEQVLPQITRAAEASGTSGGAVSGLLSQDAAARVAESQAALGLQTAAQFGQVSNQLSAIIADLAKTQDPTLQALLNALNIAKGTIDQGIVSSSGTSTKTASTEEKKDTISLESQQSNPTSFGGAITPPNKISSTQSGGTIPFGVTKPSGLDEALAALTRTQFGSGFAF